MGNVDLQDGLQLHSTFHTIPFRNFSVSLCPVINFVDTCLCCPENQWVFSLLEHFVSCRNTVNVKPVLESLWWVLVLRAYACSEEMGREVGTLGRDEQAGTQKFPPLSFMEGLLSFFHAVSISLALLSEWCKMWVSKMLNWNKKIPNRP